ncbi:MAG TPA: AAA family ATPase [Polyangium sp.]|nr:AAA family ATPase [Polyangium sp.]
MAYITRIHVENCRNVKVLDVDLSPNGPNVAGDEEPGSSTRTKLPFRHLILTGPNGSGKSGVLRSISAHFNQFALMPHDGPSAGFDRISARSLTNEGLQENLGTAEIGWGTDSFKVLTSRYQSGDFFSLFTPAKRDFQQAKAPGPSELNLNLASMRPDKSLGNLLLQFLVNKETERVHAFADGDHATAERIKKWLDQLWLRMADLMEDRQLKVSYDRQSFTFRFRRSDGYEFDLNTLADGHAAAFALIAEILLRIEAAQRLKKDFTFEPEGIVIVDEIETHLHLSLQEQILPLLTTMFPKVQFIVATHSPAVIASIPDAVVYDLRKQKQFLSSDYQGIPYGVLMTEHFGISSDIDLDSTGKLLRFRALAQQASRTPEEAHEMEDLAAMLSARSQILATEVWMVKERLGLSNVQLAGE